MLQSEISQCVAKLVCLFNCQDERKVCRLLRSRQFLPRVGPQRGLQSSAHARHEPAVEELRARVKSETQGLQRMSGRARPSTPARFRMTSKSADGSRSAFLLI